MATQAIAKLRADQRVDEILVEQGMAHHRVSYFVHLKRGWKFGDAHCFGEDTLADIKRSLRAVEACQCWQCTGDVQSERNRVKECWATYAFGYDTAIIMLGETGLSEAQADRFLFGK